MKELLSEDDYATRLDKYAAELVERAESLVGDGLIPLRGNELAEYEGIKAKLDELNERREQRDSVQAHHGAGHLDYEPQGPSLVRRIDAFDYDSHSSSIKDRALAAIEQMRDENLEADDRDRLQQAVRAETKSDDGAAFTVAAADPAYNRAFEKVLFGPDGKYDWTSEERVAWQRVINSRVGHELRTTLSLSGAAAILPLQLDPQIHLTGAGARGDFRSFARVVQCFSNVWNGVTSAGITSGWGTESSVVGDNTPSLSPFTITPIRGHAYAQVTYETLQDSAADLPVVLSRLFADAKYVNEQAAFATGAGGTAAPEGIVTKLSGTTASRVSAASNGTMSLVDVYALVNNLPARYQDSAAWAGHWGIANLIRQLGTASANTFWQDLGGNIPPQLLGAPFHQVSGMLSGLSTATASNDYPLILGDWSEFVIADRIGTVISHTDWVVDSTSQRPIGNHGFFMFYRTGSGTQVTSAFRILEV